jgi:hypothetical protein
MTITRAPTLTVSRVRLAYALAILADLVQLSLGPLGWAAADEVIDVVTMIFVTLLLGFHPLFLPTFALELVPLVDMLPTWTACVALVVSIRKKQQTPSETSSGPVIDV